MTERVAARLAWGAFAFIALLLIAGLGFSVLNWSTTTPTDWGLTEGALGADLFALGMFSFAVVGALVAARHPRNATGWILLAIGLVWQLSNVFTNYETYGLITNPGGVPRPDLSLALSQWLWVPGVGLMGTFLVLLFPDGRLPSRRWRPLAWLSAFAIVLVGVEITFGTASFAEVGYPDLRNPLEIEALRSFFEVAGATIALIPLCIVGSAVSLILRYRRSQGRERLQLKWLAAAVGAAALLYGVAMGASFPFWAFGETSLPGWVRFLQEVAIYSFVLIPIAVGAAILKYRLYDIDFIINRTLVYAALTASLALTYLGIVTLFQRLLRPLTGTSDLAVAGSTLVVAGLFGPARRRIQAFIDRRFFRHKYDAGQTVDAFSARLRAEVELDALSGELLAVVQEAMQPAHLSFWMRQPAEPD